MLEAASGCRGCRSGRKRPGDGGACPQVAWLPNQIQNPSDSQGLELAGGDGKGPDDGGGSGELLLLRAVGGVGPGSTLSAASKP